MLFAFPRGGALRMLALGAGNGLPPASGLIEDSDSLGPDAALEYAVSDWPRPGHRDSVVTGCLSTEHHSLLEWVSTARNLQIRTVVDLGLEGAP